MSPITMMLEIALALMLLVCIFTFWRLDRKLQALRSGQDGVRAAAAELAQATAQAEAAIRALRLAAHEAGRDLQGRIDDARTMGDRLAGARVREEAPLLRRRA